MTPSMFGAVRERADAASGRGQRFQQDAQAEMNVSRNSCRNEFQRKLFPVLEAVSKEKGIEVLLSAADAGVAGPKLDWT